ncbi:substrate-binding domain-containing protein [Ammoniphilus sp. 3BR4]|uniref:substrate-binding domain-containing protein n=1 Tax=Ammoniphilus sp. 3BR4 TaxID=3158265 RepID=UPI003467A007
MIPRVPVCSDRQNRSLILGPSNCPPDLNELPDLPRIKHKMDPTSQKIDDQWWQVRFSRPPLIFMEVDRPETCKEMVMQGLGYCILPRYMIKKEELSEDLFVLPLTQMDGKPFMRNLWALYREEDTNLTMVKAFVDFLKQHYNLN